MNFQTKTALFLSALMAAPAAMATENSEYGESRINQLPREGRSHHALWVGSWWAYTRNGVADRHKLRGGFGAECDGVTKETSPSEIIAQDKAFCLSPAEKVDLLEGRIGDIEWDKIAEYQTITQDQLSSLQTDIRELVRKLNKWIAENPGENWRDTDDGKAYLEKQEALDTAKESLPEITIDTATEFEHIEHGNGVAGVEGWWGHCNAWAAAAIMEDEPKARGNVTFEGNSVEFTPGEAKALLTEAWMEHHSSFKGSRSNEPENKMEDVKYSDTTPAGMHIYFASQLGQQGKSFVIDRFTGSEVWNQSAHSYKFEIEPLYENDESESIELKQTDYDWQGGASIRDLGARDVYPVHVEARIYWMTDGLPHEAATVDNILEDVYPANHTELRRAWGDQVEMRELTYTLYLDKPLSDASAKIIGDGVWDETLHGGNHSWPDFMWQPLAQTPSRRDYQNPHLDYDNLVVNHVLPATAGQVDTGGGEPGGGDAGSGSFAATDTPVAIPDNDRNGVASTLQVDGNVGTLTKAAVTVDITHTYRGDLMVTLVKDGEAIRLHNRAGGSRDDLKQTFDVPQLNGKPGSGEYVLKVVDLARRDTGDINSWKVDLEWSGGDPVDPVDPVGNAVEVTSGDTPTAIPDKDPAGIKSTINVNATGTIDTVSITVEITHTYIGDLRVELTKGDQVHMLHNNEGGSDDDLNQTYEIEALAGEALAGAWVLKVSDHAGQDVGNLESWKINANTR